MNTVTVAGVQVSALQTQAGLLPLISEPFLPAPTGALYNFGAPPGGLKNYLAVILTEGAVLRPYIDGGAGSGLPQLFQLGLVGDLQAKFMAVMFDAVLVKGPGYAHSVVAVQRT